MNYKLGLLCSTFYNGCRQVKQMQAGGRYSFFILDLDYHTLWGGQFRVFKKKKKGCWHLILDRNQVRDWAELLAMTEKRSV